MKNSNGSQFRYGLKDGVPIGLGYLAVSFTFGIMARGAGLDTWQAVAMLFLPKVHQNNLTHNYVP